MFRATLTVLSLLAAPALAVEQITLSDPAAQSYAKTLDRALAEAATAISDCVGGGGALAACQCDHREKLDEVAAALDAALEAHPEWAGQDLYLPASGGAPSINLFLGPIADSLAAIDCP